MLHQVGKVLTPGTPVYGMLKLGSLAGLFGLKFALDRRARRRATTETTPAEPAVVTRRDPHPRSRKKRRRRR